MLHAGVWLLVGVFGTGIWWIAERSQGFDRPGRGIRCATALRDRLRGTGMAIRAGVHTGEVQLRGDDVGGIAVHFAARVMAAAAPGEVLVSGTVRDLVAGSDYVLEDRGAHALKGMAGEWRLFAVRA